MGRLHNNRFGAPTRSYSGRLGRVTSQKKKTYHGMLIVFSFMSLEELLLSQSRRWVGVPWDMLTCIQTEIANVMSEALGAGMVSSMPA